jgi:hypothetical protein
VPNRGRHCHSTLSLAAIGCHSLGSHTLILLVIAVIFSHTDSVAPGYACEFLSDDQRCFSEQIVFAPPALLADDGCDPGLAGGRSHAAAPESPTAVREKPSRRRPNARFARRAGAVRGRLVTGSRFRHAATSSSSSPRASPLAIAVAIDPAQGLGGLGWRGGAGARGSGRRLATPAPQRISLHSFPPFQPSSEITRVLGVSGR